MTHALTPQAATRTTIFSFTSAALISATSSAPTPLYPLYRTLFHLTPTMLTLIFGAYAFALLAALLTVGKVSDYTGRRPLMLLALALNAIALVIFMTAGSASTLIAARLVQGFATGVALPTFGASLLDASKTRGPLLNSFTAFLGMTLGTLAGGILVSLAPYPTVTLYALLLLLMLFAMTLLPLIPETISLQPGVLAALRPQVSIPRRALGPLLKVAPVNIATWMLGGFYLSLMPTMVANATGLTSPFIGGSVVATLMLSATAAVFLFRPLPPARALVIGTLMLMTGVSVTLTGLSLHSVAWLYIGTALAGQGFGSIFANVLKIIMQLAESHERAGLFSAFLIKSYLAFALPAIAAGIVAPHLGLTRTAWCYGMTILVLAMVSLLAVRGRALAGAAGS
ncbi:MFS transporter [Pantoea anthophila]|uniref:MFS transporter n=1 Tax=Pantoea anthophila TaxID=470931 RepID=UPI003CECF045